MISGVKIGIVGKARSGKDTVADYLVENYEFRKFAFGDALKKYYHRLFGESVEKPREGYQWFGQAMRDRDPDVWVRKLFERLEWAEIEQELYPSHSPNVVISDCRQPNEYARLKAEGFYIIRVNCPRYLRIERMRESGDKFSAENLTHETESHIESFAVDFEIYNSGKLRGTYEQIDVIMREIYVKEAEYLGTR